MRIDSIGNLSWSKTYGGSSHDGFRTVTKAEGSGYILSGGTSSPELEPYRSSDFWLVKIDNTGNTIWSEAIGGTMSEMSRSMTQTSDGGFVVAGLSKSNDGYVHGNNGDYDFWVVNFKKEQCQNPYDRSLQHIAMVLKCCLYFVLP